MKAIGCCMNILLNIYMLIYLYCSYRCYRCKVKIIDLDTYEIKYCWGRLGMDGDGFSSPSSIEAFKIGSQHVLFLGIVNYVNLLYAFAICC